jgi:hypothetical protein
MILESWKGLHPELAAVMFTILSEKAWEELQPLELTAANFLGS